MDDLGFNPFQLLTFIVAPAILTNASSVMVLGTSNRFARAIDRARALSAQVEGKEHDPSLARASKQLGYSRRRVLLLVRALTAYYLAVGSFAAATLISLVGAVFFVAHQDLLRHISLGIALLAGVTGVAGLVCGSALLVWESRLALRILVEESELIHARPAPAKDAAGPPEASSARPLR